jgi:hypothetical protein
VRERACMGNERTNNSELALPYEVYGCICVSYHERVNLVPITKRRTLLLSGTYRRDYRSTVCVLYCTVMTPLPIRPGFKKKKK